MKRLLIALALICATGCLQQCQAVGRGAIGGGAVGEGVIGGGAVGGAPSSSGFTLPSPAVLYAARLETGFSDGGSVDSITNHGTKGGTASQGTAANRPTWEENELDSSAVFRFDGAGDKLEQSSLALDPSTLICWVAESDAPAANDSVFFVDETSTVDGSSAGARLLLKNTVFAWEPRLYAPYEDTTFQMAERTLVSANHWQQGCMYVTDRSGLDPFTQFWIDGQKYVRNQSSTATWSPDYVSLGAGSWDGDIAEFRVYEGVEGNLDAAAAAARDELVALYPSLPQAATLSPTHRWTARDEAYGDGANVTAMSDLGSDGSWDLASTGSPPEFATAEYNGLAAVDFEASSTEYLRDTFASVTYPVTICALHRAETGGTEVLANLYAGTTLGTGSAYLFNFTGVGKGITANSLTNTGRPSTGYQPPLGEWVYSCGYFPHNGAADTTVRVLSDGLLVTGGTGGADNSATKITVGGGGDSGSTPWDGMIADLLIWEGSTPSAPDLNEAVLSMRADLAAPTCDASSVTGCPASGECKVAIIGDSLSSWDYHNYDNYAEQLRRHFDATLGRGCVQFTNLAIGGQGSADLLNDWNDRVEGNGYDILITWGGNNDIRDGTGTGSEGTDMVANLDTIHAEANAEGITVINLGMFPYKNDTYASWSSDKQSQTDAAMADLAADGTITYLDAYGTIEDGSLADELNSAYDHGDGVHLNTAGNDAIFSLVLGAL